MATLYYRKDDMIFNPHPQFTGVDIARLITSSESSAASVCMLSIAAGIEIPVHVHDPQVDSIFVVEGAAEAMINGQWEPISAGDFLYVRPGVDHGIRNCGVDRLLLFVHHSPPLF